MIMGVPPAMPLIALSSPTPNLKTYENVKYSRKRRYARRDKGSDALCVHSSIAIGGISCI